MFTARNLPAGTHYLVVDGNSAGTGDFALQLTLAPATMPLMNDTCANPTTLVPGMPVMVDANAAGPGLHLLVRESARRRRGLPIHDHHDAEGDHHRDGREWSRCGALAAQRSLRRRHESGRLPRLEPRRGDPGADAPAGTYFVVLGSYDDVDGQFSLELRLNPPPSAPANDTCSAAAMLVPNMSQMVDVTVANPDYMFDCAMPALGEAVYTFTTTAPQRVKITATGSTDADAVLALRGMPCDTSTDMVCVNDGSSGDPEVISFNNLPAGTYYVLLASDGTDGELASSSRCCRMWEPTNETCASPEVVTLTAGTATVAADLSLAMADIASDLCATNGSGADVVYEVTIPANQTLTVVGTPAGSSLDLVLFARSPACATMPSEECEDFGGSGDAETITVSNTTGAPKTVFVVAKAYFPAAEIVDLTFTVNLIDHGTPSPLTLSRWERELGTQGAREEYGGADQQEHGEAPAPMTGLDRMAIARRLAVVPQVAALPFAARVEEVVGLGRLPHEDPFRGHRPADQAAIAGAMEPVGIGGLIGRDARELSLGERQLVLLALAVAQAAPLLILDEPTVHLDLRHQVGTMDLLVDLNERDGTTVLAVLHDRPGRPLLPEARAAGRRRDRGRRPTRAGPRRRRIRAVFGVDPGSSMGRAIRRRRGRPPEPATRDPGRVDRPPPRRLGCGGDARAQSGPVAGRRPSGTDGSTRAHARRPDPVRRARWVQRRVGVAGRQPRPDGVARIAGRVAQRRGIGGGLGRTVRRTDGRPTAQPTPDETPGEATSSPASGGTGPCFGSAKTRAFISDFAQTVSWPVYCAILSKDWWLEHAEYRLANGGRLTIIYRRRSDSARLVLDEGSVCAETTPCVPGGSGLGPIPFSDRQADLSTISGGFAAVVDVTENPAWLLTGTGIGREGLQRDRGQAPPARPVGPAGGAGQRPSAGLSGRGRPPPGSRPRRRWSASPPRPMSTAVAPNPTTGPAARIARMEAVAVSSDSPPGSGMATAQSPDASRASRSKAM